jgi:murein DD-endopeptidase MepM/ murein hydrolase activator NlpD
MKSFRDLGGRLNGVKRPRLFVALALPIVLPLVLAAVRDQPEFGSVNSAAAVPPIQLRYDELRKPFRAELPEHSLILTVEQNDTLDAILTSGGLSRGESALLTREFGKSIDLRRIKPGHLVRFHYDQNGIVDSVQMKVTGWGQLNAIRSGAAFTVAAEQAVLRRIETSISASVNRSLYEAIRETGEGPALVQQLVDVFQWDVDFFQLRKGDSFSFVVSKHYAGSDVVGYGPITAARFTHRGTTYEAFRHENADGTAGYYGRAGAPLRKQFLKAPLKFTRVTSGFSKKRFHPVLNVFRPHHGIDYGAPTGTPVMTTADGVVVEARFKTGEGNFVRIRHNSAYETYYLHLSRFAKGLKKGTKVAQGDVIGYVGATGLATGPHLDYRVTERGKWLNPLHLKSITPDPLRGGQLARFKANAARLAGKLETPGVALAEKSVQQRALF